MPEFRKCFPFELRKLSSRDLPRLDRWIDRAARATIVAASLGVAAVGGKAMLDSINPEPQPNTAVEEVAVIGKRVFGGVVLPAGVVLAGLGGTIVSGYDVRRRPQEEKSKNKK